MPKLKLKLKTEINTPDMHDRVVQAFDASIDGEPCFCQTHSTTAHFEHGQWWVACARCGGQWSVCDATGHGSVDGFTFECVAEPDEESTGPDTTVVADTCDDCGQRHYSDDEECDGGEEADAEAAENAAIAKEAGTCCTDPSPAVHAEDHPDEGSPYCENCDKDLTVEEYDKLAADLDGARRRIDDAKAKRRISSTREEP